MKSTFAPMNVANMSEKENEDALELLMLFKDKSGGAYKGRERTDGRKQWEGSQKKDATYPTVALELVLTTSAIHAHESRYVAIVDIPGEFLTAGMD